MADQNEDDDRPPKKKTPRSEDIKPGATPRKQSRPRPDDDDDDEEEDGRIRRVKRSAPDDGGVGIVIPYRNGMALASYYLGIFGLILCFLGGVPGILGIIPFTLGVLGFKKARSDPDARGSVHAWVGIILGGIEMLFGCAVAGFFGYAVMQKK